MREGTGDMRVIITRRYWGRGDVEDASILSIGEGGLGLGDARIIIVARRCWGRGNVCIIIVVVPVLGG